MRAARAALRKSGGYGASVTTTLAFATSGTQDASLPAGSTVAWTQPENITADDANRAVAALTSATSRYLYAGFNLSAIPDGSAIDGIEIVGEITSTVASTVEESVVRLRKGDGTFVGDNKARVGTKWGTGTVFQSWGSSSDKWNAALTAADIKDANFRCAVSMNNPTATAGSARFDTIGIRVTYRPPA